MGDLVFATITELKSEFTALPFKMEGLKKIEQSANSIISNYRMQSQTLEDGSPFWGKEEAIKASSESDRKQNQFEEACKELITHIKQKIYGS